MGLFNRNKKKSGGVMDVIRCDEQSYLIWKWHPEGTEKGNNKRENAIRLGSSLRVKDGEVAVFVYKQKDGMMQDYIVGPFDEILKTKNLPILASIVGLAYDGGTPFQAEVYFINLAQIIQVKFAVPFFDVYDPQLEEFGVPTAVRGTISFRIGDYKEFIKLHRLIDFNLDDFQNQIKDVVIRYTKDVVTNVPAMNDIPLIQLETKTALVNDRLEMDISERLGEDFGVIVAGIDINSIEFDKTSEGYKRLLSVTRDVTSATIQAETEAKLKDISDKQRIEMENYEETLRIQREEGQYAQHKETQSNNIDAFKIEKQSEVGIAGAEALGKMGESGAGNVNISNGGDGFNMTSMMASMAVGNTVGQNIANSMNNMMSGLNSSTDVGNKTPSIKEDEYYLAVDGKPTGPFSIKLLKEMIISGKITRNSLLWKDGMKEWKKAEQIEELKGSFMPTIPTNE